VACDFFVSVTATFRLFYVFLVIGHGSRWLVHFTITRHPTAPGTLRQLREIIGCGEPYFIDTFSTMATASSSCTSMSPSSASGLELIGDREPADPLAGRGEDRVAQRGRNRAVLGARRHRRAASRSPTESGAPECRAVRRFTSGFSQHGHE
jgi:hypothetical protein